MKAPRTFFGASLLIVLCACFAGALPCRATDSPDSVHVENLLSLDLGHTLVRDVGYVFSAPLNWDADDWSAFTIRAASLMGTSVLLDDPIRDFAQRNRGDASEWVADRVDRFGLNYPTWVMGGFLITGLVFDNRTAKMVAIDGIAANLITGNIITPFLKRSIGRHRPFKGDGRFEFDSFSGHDSFPSGHATTAFVNAAVIAAHYDQWWVKTIAYGIATLVAFARVNYDAHYASDVLAGAFIGIAIGEGIVRVNNKARGL